MRFPNLIFAIDESRLRHYELADRVGMESSRFSRCVRGRFDFAPQERKRIAKLLRYPEAWLFALATPPARNTSRPRIAA